MTGARGPVAIVLVVLLAGGCAAVAGTAQPPPSIRVHGVGTVSVRPDVALAQLGAEARAPLLADASAEVARRMALVLARVRALGLTDRDITTVSYSVEPLVAPRRFDEDPPARITGYRVTNVVQLRVRDLSALGRVLDSAVDVGANVVRHVTLTLSETARAEAMATARARAVQDATERARQLAQQAGVGLGELLLLADRAPAPYAVRERLDLATAAARAPGPVEPGELEITATVEAHFALTAQ